VALGAGACGRPRQRAGGRAGPPRPGGKPAAALAGALAGALLAAGPAAAQQAKPLWEVGFAAGGGYLPDYPAAGQNHFNALGLPYLVYRGEFLRAGDKGLVRGRVLKTRDVEFDISVSGSFSVDAEDSDARVGMPDLDYLGEVGPRLQWTLARSGGGAKLDLELPVRAVFSTDLSRIDYRGIRAAPELAYQLADALGTGIALKLGLSADFATEELHDYFYEVEPRFAAAGRPAYRAEGGYLGSKLELSLVRPLNGQIRLFSLASVAYHRGAANEASPLFEDEVNYAVGVGVVVSLWQSRQQVRE